MAAGVSELTEKLRPHARVPRAAIQQEEVANRARREEKARGHLDALIDDVRALETWLEQMGNELAAFQQRYGDTPDAIAALVQREEAELKRLQTEARDSRAAASFARSELETLLSDRVAALVEWGLLGPVEGPAEVLLEKVRAAHEEALREAKRHDLGRLKRKVETLNERIREIVAEVAGIDELLKRVEELVIHDAVVVATTLTRAYLRDHIQSRRFDTVVLDEASMAPIPALWVAATLSDSSVAIVGDFRQLPPIVQSDHALAQEWLGRDVFDVSGTRKAYEAGQAPEHFVALRRQYRMHPSICNVPNALFYGNLLQTDDSALSDGELDAWHERTWGPDEPLTVVDTQSTGAWVTTVTRGGSPSRLNFLSANLCVELAEGLLKEGRPPLDLGDAPRILLICPYRAHARLMELLIKEADLYGEVVAGTVHSFQGTEADVVIVDLVNDEPHWRVNICIPKNDEDTKRLFNVALTRARRRLIVVGDLKYVQSISSKAFLGREFIPFLRDRATVLDALDVSELGLAARAAAAQVKVMGGAVEPDADRIVVRQDDFYRYLIGDLAEARQRVLIYSPFITESRLSALEPQLQGCSERGVQVVVVTKPISERPKAQQQEARRLERALTEWEAVVLHKVNMHEKLLVIDDDVLWFGSLNPLSFSNTQEIMERRRSRAVVSDFLETLKVADLLGALEAREYECPVCGQELILAEGRDEPFYWRCVEDSCDWSRSIGQSMPTDGRIDCANCGASVEFGEWGGRPAWRCISNKQHRQRVARSHLKLPKMRDLIPKSELRQLERQLGLM